jgi:hypothetical protein
MMAVRCTRENCAGSKRRDSDPAREGRRHLARCFAVACTDGEDDNWLLTIGNDGGVSPFAFNSLSDSEFAGATFSPGETLLANIQSDGVTVAIWGPWAAGCR